MRDFDPSQGCEYPIYSPEGEFSSWRFEQWLISVGITAWPRLDSGALQLDGDTFRMMYGAHTAIEGLHALRDSLGVIVRARIPIGPDGRNRPSLFPFGTATGRNAQAKSLFNAHAGMRSFMKFPAGRIGLYLDWRTQEIAIAAARSGDAQLAEAMSFVRNKRRNRRDSTRSGREVAWPARDPARRAGQKATARHDAHRALHHLGAP